MNEASMELARQFAAAVAGKDRAQLLRVLAPDVDFRALTPGRLWESSSAVEVADDIVFGHWFEAHDHIEERLSVDTNAMADRTHLSYRVRVRNDDGPHLVEQHAYIGDEGGRITFLRILCSGYRPIDE